MDSSDITALEHIQIFTYIDVGSFALLVFDYFLTIEMEIKYIWTSTWSIPKMMYLFTRYLPFFEAAVVLHRTFGLDLSVKTCNQSYYVSAVLILAGIIVAELILSLRTWAVWERNRIVGIGLVVFSLAVAIPTIPVMVLFSGSAKFIDPPYHPFNGCFLQGGSHIISLEWILLMIYDGALLALMSIQAFRTLRNANQSFLKIFFTTSRSDDLMKSILKDGILYYFYLFVLSSLNVVVIWSMPPDFVNLLTMIERVIHALFTCRVVLNLKESGRTESHHDTIDEYYEADTALEFGTQAQPEPAPLEEP